MLVVVAIFCPSMATVAPTAGSSQPASRTVPLILANSCPFVATVDGDSDKHPKFTNANASRGRYERRIADFMMQ